jgi:hypothetical protein
MHAVAGVEDQHACGVISVATEFMVDVAGVEARPCVRSISQASRVSLLLLVLVPTGCQLELCCNTEGVG